MEKVNKYMSARSYKSKPSNFVRWSNLDEAIAVFCKEYLGIGSSKKGSRDILVLEAFKIIFCWPKMLQVLALEF